MACSCVRQYGVVALETGSTCPLVEAWGPVEPASSGRTYLIVHNPVDGRRNSDLGAACIIRNKINLVALLMVASPRSATINRDSLVPGLWGAPPAINIRLRHYCRTKCSHKTFVNTLNGLPIEKQPINIPSSHFSTSAIRLAVDRPRLDPNLSPTTLGSVGQ